MRTVVHVDSNGIVEEATDTKGVVTTHHGCLRAELPATGLAPGFRIRVQPPPG